MTILELSALPRGLVDGGLDVELQRLPLAEEGLELAERDLDLAHVEDEVGTVGW